MLDRTRPIMSSESARPTGTLDAEAAWSALEHVHAKLVQTVRGSDGLALGTIAVPHPVLGPINLYQWISFVGGHEARHAAQIAELQPSPVGS